MHYPGVKRQFAFLIRQSTFGGHEMIPAVSGKSIIITDIFISAAENNAKPEISLWEGPADDTEGGLEFFVWFPEYANSSSLNFSGPLTLKVGKAFTVEATTSDTDYSILVNYFYL